jgi:hypothetical protein
MKKHLLLLTIITMIVSSCGPTIFLSPDAKSRASQHETLAILPPKISIPASKNVSAEAMAEQRQTESLNFQNEIYKQLLRRVTRGEMRVNLQDVEQTNAIIARSFPDGIYTTEEVCKALNVDAVMTSQFGLSKPMSQGAAIAAYVLFGGIGATNEVNVNMSLKDCSDSKLLWNYDWRYQGSLGSSPEDLVESLMRNASRKIPYYTGSY